LTIRNTGRITGMVVAGWVRATQHEVLEKFVAATPVKRLSPSVEIGSVVAWLASAESDFTTGADIS